MFKGYFKHFLHLLGNEKWSLETVFMPTERQQESPVSGKCLLKSYFQIKDKNTPWLRFILILFPKPNRTVAFLAQNPPEKSQKKRWLFCPRSILPTFLSGKNFPSARCDYLWLFVRGDEGFPFFILSFPFLVWESNMIIQKNKWKLVFNCQRTSDNWSVHRK